MVFLILCTRWCLNVRERRAPESTTNISEISSFAGVASVAVAVAAVVGAVAAAIASSKMPIVVVDWRGFKTFC